MKYATLLIVIALLFLMTGSVFAMHEQDATVVGDYTGLAIAQITDAEDGIVGYVVFTEGDVVNITYNLTGLSPGAHAFHVHETGECKPPFKSAGGHFNPFGAKHGIKNPVGRHAGDLPNIVVGSDGTSAGMFLESLMTLKEGKNSLFKSGGTAIVIHEGPDDYQSDPAGNAGERVACGVIKKVR